MTVLSTQIKMLKYNKVNVQQGEKIIVIIYNLCKYFKN